MQRFHSHTISPGSRERERGNAVPFLNFVEQIDTCPPPNSPLKYLSLSSFEPFTTRSCIYVDCFFSHSQKDHFLLIRFSTNLSVSDQIFHLFSQCDAWFRHNRIFLTNFFISWIKMGQVEEQRFMCRICSKPCVSGKSLGGHMRAHLASKKSAVNPNCVKEFGDSDESKHALTAKTTNSCRECGKEFASLRALSGHMRFHSIKNKKRVHLCKECGRGFESMRAVFGHMKSHSIKKVPSVVVENFCPVRRKRSEIKYKGTVSANPSFSGVDASHCGASEVEEAEEAARCLVMLSRGGVGSFSKLVSYSDHSGGVVSSNVSEFENGMEVDLVCDEGFLKDGIGSNGCDDESCENGADLEMVEEKHRAMSSDRVKQEMGSGGSARGSLRGAASMRRCSSLLEMDAVAVIW